MSERVAMSDAAFRRLAHAYVAARRASANGSASLLPGARLAETSLLAAGPRQHPLDPSIPVPPDCACAWEPTGRVDPERGEEVRFVPCDPCVRRAEALEAADSANRREA